MRHETMGGLLFIIIEEKQSNIQSYLLSEIPQLTKLSLWTTHPPFHSSNHVFITKELFRKKLLCEDFLVKWNNKGYEFAILKQEIINSLLKSQNLICILNLKDTENLIKLRKLPQKNYIVISTKDVENDNFDYKTSSKVEIKQIIERLI